MSPEPDPDPIGVRFEPGVVFATRYRMIRRIGRGGVGDVWRADDLVLDIPVALKVIHSTAPEARARILSEVRLARQITHPAVCRVFDIGEAGGDLFFSMELVRGDDLSALLKRVGRLPSEKVIDIGRQVCAGLAAAHAQHVLHRALKPANVLVDDDGQVRITDFGIAVTGPDTAQHTRTAAPDYLAPEQRVPGSPLSERTDLYALGLVLYELLTARHPFAQSGAAARPPRPSTLVPNVNPQLERVVMQALSPDPRDRPASAAEIAATLSDIDARRDTAPVAAAAAGRQIKTRGWLAWTALTSVVVALLVVSLFFLSPGVRTLTAQDTIVLPISTTPPASRSSTGRSRWRSRSRWSSHHS